jgi:hypothetical protein
MIAAFQLSDHMFAFVCHTVDGIVLYCGTICRLSSLLRYTSHLVIVILYFLWWTPHHLFFFSSGNPDRRADISSIFFPGSGDHTAAQQQRFLSSTPEAGGFLVIYPEAGPVCATGCVRCSCAPPLCLCSVCKQDSRLWREADERTGTSLGRDEALAVPAKAHNFHRPISSLTRRVAWSQGKARCEARLPDGHGSRAPIQPPDSCSLCAAPGGLRGRTRVASRRTGFSQWRLFFLGMRWWWLVRRWQSFWAAGARR